VPDACLETMSTGARLAAIECTDKVTALMERHWAGGRIGDPQHGEGTAVRGHERASAMRVRAAGGHWRSPAQVGELSTQRSLCGRRRSVSRAFASAQAFLDGQAER
jgi:hypothetical protein